MGVIVDLAIVGVFAFLCGYFVGFAKGWFAGGKDARKNPFDWT